MPLDIAKDDFLTEVLLPTLCVVQCRGLPDDHAEADKGRRFVHAALAGFS